MLKIATPARALRTGLILLAAGAPAVGLVACGTEPAGEHSIIGVSPNGEASKPTVPAANSRGDGGIVAVPDCSGSTDAIRFEWIDGLIQTATDALLSGYRFRSDCLDGAPLSSFSFPIDIEPATPEVYEGNGELEENFLRAKAAGLRPKFEDMLSKTGETFGSGILEAVEAVLRLDPTMVVAFTDAIVVQKDFVIDEGTTKADINDALKRWAPRLEQLRGRTLMIVGGGRDTGDGDISRTAYEFFDALTKRVGATLEWVPSV